MTFEFAGLGTLTRQVQVQLGQDTTFDVVLKVQGVAETVEAAATISPVRTSPWPMDLHMVRPLEPHAVDDGSSPSPASASSNRSFVSSLAM